jgi:hypothetical protein
MTHNKNRSRDACAPELCQRQSQNRPSEQDRVTPKPAVGPAFGSIMLRQAQSGNDQPALSPLPDFTSFHPGYERKKEAERRQAH